MERGAGEGTRRAEKGPLGRVVEKGRGSPSPSPRARVGRRGGKVQGTRLPEAGAVRRAVAAAHLARCDRVAVAQRAATVLQRGKRAATGFSAIDALTFETAGGVAHRPALGGRAGDGQAAVVRLIGNAMRDPPVVAPRTARVRIRLAHGCGLLRGEGWRSRATQVAGSGRRCCR